MLAEAHPETLGTPVTPAIMVSRVLAVRGVTLETPAVQVIPEIPVTMVLLAQVAVLGSQVMLELPATPEIEARLVTQVLVALAGMLVLAVQVVAQAALVAQFAYSSTTRGQNLLPHLLVLLAQVLVVPVAAHCQEITPLTLGRSLFKLT